jgi:hypothetical protein
MVCKFLYYRDLIAFMGMEFKMPAWRRALSPIFLSPSARYRFQDTAIVDPGFVLSRTHSKQFKPRFRRCVASGF